MFCLINSLFFGADLNVCKWCKEQDNIYLSKKKRLIFIKGCMLTLVFFRKLGQIKCKALWVVGSFNCCNLHKDRSKCIPGCVVEMHFLHHESS